MFRLRLLRLESELIAGISGLSQVRGMKQREKWTCRILRGWGVRRKFGVWIRGIHLYGMRAEDIVCAHCIVRSKRQGHCADLKWEQTMVRSRVTVAHRTQRLSCPVCSRVKSVSNFGTWRMCLLLDSTCKYHVLSRGKDVRYKTRDEGSRRLLYWGSYIERLYTQPRWVSRWRRVTWEMQFSCTLWTEVPGWQKISLDQTRKPEIQHQRR
jgi:hypothetical protein